MSEVVAASVDSTGYDIPPNPPFGRYCVLEPKKSEDYSLLDRLKSFHSWPIAHPISGEKLALAGFVYSGVGDKVQCHSCKIKLSKFDADDIPWLEHARWAPKCRIVREKMKTL